MTITFNLAAFAEAARALAAIPSASMRIDILDCALAEAGGGKLALTMSNMDVEATVTIPAEGEGRAAIPRAVMNFFTRRDGMAGGDTGSLEFDGRRVVARHGKGKLAIGMLPADDFPRFVRSEPAWSFPIRAHEFCAALAGCERAIADQETRPYLCGVFLHRLDDGLGFVATDGHRLHKLATDLPEIAGKLATESGMPGVIVPDLAVARIQKLFAGDESEIRVAGTDSHLVVEADRIRFASKLIDGVYPDYQRAIPEPGEARIRLDAKALDAALDGLMVIPRTDGKGKAVSQRPVRIGPGDGDEILLEMAGDNGDCTDRVPAKVEGSFQPFIVAANFLRDLIASCGGGEMDLAPVHSAVRIFAKPEASDWVVMQRTKL